MNQAELINVTIDQYNTLQRIKRCNKEENPELEHELKVTRAKLQTFGVNLTDIEYTN